MYRWVLLIMFASLSLTFTISWGFEAHKKITYQATFTVPAPLFGFVKDNISYLTEHSVDPDKRRIVQKGEAKRHYIDLDHWEKVLPIDTLAFSFDKAIFQNTVWLIYDSTQQIDSSYYPHQKLQTDSIDLDSLFIFFKAQMPTDGSSEWESAGYASAMRIRYKENLQAHGILPYFLLRYSKQLEKAFANHDKDQVLSLMSSISHYIADAHVPLHTTTNYNGQLTGQLGIHSFWETTIPSLFIDDFNFFTPKALYEKNLDSLFWEIVIESHALVPIVLQTEQKVRSEVNELELKCFDMQKKVSPLPCKNFASKYEVAMGGMVEKRMRQAIQTVGTVWYTCWVNAGQPPLEQMKAKK